MIEVQARSCYHFDTASIRCHPSTCWSDCGTNFVGAQSYLNEVMQNLHVPKIPANLHASSSGSGIHHMQVTRMEWWSPFIKLVRQALDVTCKNHTLTQEQWRTFLAEITYLINS